MSLYNAASATHVIVYHLVTAGSCWVRLENGSPVVLEEGDVVVFPHGDPHLMGNGHPAEGGGGPAELESIFASRLELARMGGGGEPTRYVCGYMACERHSSAALFSGLPPLLQVNIRGDPRGAWIESARRSAVAGAAEPGQPAVIAKLSEALLVETLRRYVAVLPAEQIGPLAASRNPHISRALALMHSQAGNPWSLAELARE